MSALKWIGGIGAALVLLLVAGGAYQSFQVPQEAAPYPPPGQIVKVNGAAQHLYCLGTDQPTIVIDFGIGNWSVHWSHLMEELSRSARLCAFDRPGLGWSDPIEGSYSGDVLATQLHDVLQAAGESPPFVLVGHSFGGYIVRTYHHLYRDQVAGVVLVDASHEDQWTDLPPEVNEMIEATLSQMRLAQIMAPFGLLRFMELPLPDPLPSAEQRNHVRAQMVRGQYYATMRKLFDEVENVAAATGDLGNLGSTPLLVLTAGDSASAYCGESLGIDVPCDETQAVWDRLQADLATLSTDSRHFREPNARHYIQLDAPDFVVSHMGAFVEDIRP